MSQDQITQAGLQQLIQKIIKTLETIWDNPNPGPREKAMLDLVTMMLGLDNPQQTLHVFHKLRAAAKQGRSSTLVLLTDAAQTEFDLVSYILGDGKTVPSWSDIAAKVVELARADTTTPPAARPKPGPRPQTPPPASGQSPTDFLNSKTAGQSSAPSAAQAAPAPDPDPASQPANGDDKTNTTSRGRRPRIR